VQVWHMKQNFKTPAYTTDWANLLTVQMDGAPKRRGAR
jgi:DNA polymerase V